MRLINMRNLAHVRAQYLQHHTPLGKGSFSTVYADNQDEARVAKVTTDRLSYAFLSDGYWFIARELVEDSFPSLLSDVGKVGESNGLDAYLVEVERLYPVSNPEHRRTIRRWIAEHGMHRSSEISPNTALKSIPLAHHRASVSFCKLKATDFFDPYAKVFEALADFLCSFGGALDLKMNNFMERADGTLVWNDVVFDVDTFHKATTRRYH